MDVRELTGARLGPALLFGCGGVNSGYSRPDRRPIPRKRPVKGKESQVGSAQPMDP
jgi:hypothetical protein